jgi:DNA-binding transcriptional ArsR family regulator
MAYWLVVREAAISEAFRALADPTRRRLFERLVDKGELTVSALTEGSGISQPAVSQHVASLKAAGLVKSRRDGRQTHYAPRARGLAPLVNWFAVYAVFWQDRFDRLEQLLDGMDT